MAHARSSLLAATSLFLVGRPIPLLLLLIALHLPFLAAFHRWHYLSSLNVLPALWTSLMKGLIDGHRRGGPMVVVVVDVCGAVDVQNYVVR